jgi:predicted RNA-binding Zn ribbon-like protein
MEHFFPCGSLALDFVGTLRSRRDAGQQELLGAPANLDAWFREAGLVDADLGTRNADLEAAVELRESIYVLVRACMSGTGYDERALGAVNRTASAPTTVPQLTAGGRRIEATPTQALSALARDAISILTGSDAELLKECGRPSCTQVYIDRSRGGRREWCAMDPCGNAMKAAAYRARKRPQEL